MPENRRDDPRDRWRDDDRPHDGRPYRDYDYYARARRDRDHAGAAYERRDRDGDHGTRGYGYSRGYGRGEYAGGGPRRGRWGREEDYAAGYRDHYLMNHGRARDRAEFGQPDRDWAGRRGDEDGGWFADDRDGRDDRAGRRRRRQAAFEDEDDYRRGQGPHGRYRDDW